MKRLHTSCLFGAVALALGSVGCAADAGPGESSMSTESDLTSAPQAIAFLDSAVSASGLFSPQADGSVLLNLTAYQGPAGTHAVRILNTPNDCGSSDLNPTGTKDVGDIGDIVIRNGYGFVSMTSSSWSTVAGSADNILGHPLVIYNGSDAQLKAGSSRARRILACSDIFMQSTTGGGGGVHW